MESLRTFWIVLSSDPKDDRPIDLSTTIEHDEPFPNLDDAVKEAIANLEERDGPNQAVIYECRPVKVARRRKVKVEDVT